MQRLVNNIFNYKVEMMGLAILLIMLFHLALPTTLWGIKNTFEIGVDLFLFLGGFTCARSYSLRPLFGANGRYSAFYKKRVWRVLPPFLLLYVFVYGYEYLWNNQGDWTGFFERITMWSNLAHQSVRMWYIPALMLMYMLLPIYVDACKKWKKLQWLPMVLVAVLVLAILIDRFDVFPFRMAWVRLPIFLLGVNFYLWKDSKREVGRLTISVVTVQFLFLAWWVRFYNINLGRICFIPLVIAIIYYFDVLKGVTLKRVFSVLGGFTLELYLIQEYVQFKLYENLSVDMLIMFITHPLFLRHALGAQAVICAFLSLPVGILLAYAYHRLLKATIYSK